MLHKAGPLLLQYASAGCLVDCGWEWTLEDCNAAVEKGPHQSALHLEAVAQFCREAVEKERQGFC